MLLIGPSNRPGTFIIRESESIPGIYALSMKDPGGGVRHYHVGNTYDGMLLNACSSLIFAL